MPSDLPPKKKVVAEFFRTEAGNEPVREALHTLGRPTKTVVGEDVRFVELNWRVDRPYVDRLRSGKGEFERSIYEVRHGVLVHFFQKKTRTTPLTEISVAWDRMKQWVKEERRVEAEKAKRGKR